MNARVICPYCLVVSNTFSRWRAFWQESSNVACWSRATVSAYEANGVISIMATACECCQVVVNRNSFFLFFLFETRFLFFVLMDPVVAGLQSGSLSAIEAALGAYRSILLADTCATCPDSEHLFAAWDYLAANNAPTHTVLDVLALAVTASRMLGYRAVATEMVRKVIRDYLAALYRNLNSGSHLLIASSLRLLRAMVMHGQTTTRELEQVFSF